jgi:acetyl esterase/lipase
VANRFTREGYIVIIPDYVKYPSAVYPAFVEDAAAVSNWIALHATEYSIDKSSLYLMGHSAGAHTGMMLIADESYLAKYRLEPSFYRAFIGISGPYDFTPRSRYYRKIFGPEERFHLMQATNYIDGSEPPMFLLNAGLDWLVADSNTEKVFVAMEQSGGQIQIKSYPGLGHMTIIGSLSDSLPIGSDVSNDILAFINNLETVDDLSMAPAEQTNQIR